MSEHSVKERLTDASAGSETTVPLPGGEFLLGLLFEVRAR